MAVTKQTYTLNPTWTAAQLADTVKQAFIDAGLMADWFDSFLSGTFENRILRIVYNAGATYGTTYHWFKFTTTGIFYNVANGWNVITHVPSGTVRKDYHNTTTNAQGVHRQVATLNNTSTFQVRRYTSAINTGFSYFTFFQSSAFYFTIPTATWGPQSWLDLNRAAFTGIVTYGATTSTYTSLITFNISGQVGRSYLGGWLNNAVGVDTSNTWINNDIQLSRWGGYAYSGDNSSGIIPQTNAFFIPMNSTTFSGTTEDYFPTVTGPFIAPYFPNLPADFAVTSYYPLTTPTINDTFVVSSGTNEWDILLASYPVSTATYPKTLLLARTVG